MDISRVEKRRACRFSLTLFWFAQGHPRALSIFETPDGFSVPFPLSKGRSRPFKTSEEGVGFVSPLHVKACVSRVDISSIEKRRGRKLLGTLFRLAEAHPRAFSDVTISAFVLRGFETFTS